MPSTARDSLRSFPPDKTSVGEARWFVRRTLEAWEAPELVDEASLVTSELVTNAVIHAGTTVQVQVVLDAFRLRMEVQDQHPARALPLGVPAAAEDAENGRGLLITSSIATSWGVEYTDALKRVWVEIDRGRGGESFPSLEGTDAAEMLVAVVEVSGNGIVRGWNDDAHRLLGWAPGEVIGDRWDRLVASPLPVGSGPGERGQGELSLRTKEGGLVQTFAARHDVRQHGFVLLLVPVTQRALLERAPTAATTSAGRAEADPAGLRGDALTRLGIDDYLALAVERCRSQVGADATYLLLSRSFDSDLEVIAVSGLDARLLGRRFKRDAPGTLNQLNPRLPVVETDIADRTVPLLTGTELRSLLVVPVFVDGRPVGALGAATDRPGGLDEAQATVLHQVAGSLAIATDRARLRAAELERRHWLGLVDEAGLLLAGSLDQQMTMALTGQVVVPQLATWCAIHLRDERGHPVLEHVWHQDERQLDALREALEADELHQLDSSRQEALRGPLHSIPLVAHGREIGTLTLGRPGSEPLGGEILHVAESLAGRAATAMDNARVHGELKAAGYALQRSLLPPSIPSPPGLDVGVVYEPAGESTTAGGDFYDLFGLGDGRWCWVVGDVCGTGAEAAAVTGLARHTIRALALAGFPLTIALERLNSAILDEGERARFLTLACGVVEPVRKGRAALSLVVAGHPPPFLVRRRDVRQIGRPQSLLGVEERVTYTEDHLELERGDLLVTVTDGVLESRAGSRMLGEDGFEAALANLTDLSAQVVAERVRRLVLDYIVGPNRDDMAILALQVRRSDEPQHCLT